MRKTSFHVILNRTAGTAAATGVTRAEIEKLFVEAGLEFDIDDDETSPLPERIARAVAGPAETVVAAGGDGTVLAVAEALLGTDKTMAILPLGTLNALARELGLPLDLAGAISVLPSCERRLIDVADVNGRPFLHNVQIGVTPGIAVGREFIRGRRGVAAVIGFMRFLIRRLQRARRMALMIETEAKGARVERLTTLMIASNSYQQKFGAVMTRRRLDRGILTVYIVRSLTPIDAVRLAVEMFLGRWRDDEVVEYEASRAVLVRSKKKQLLTTVDGEVVTLNTPLVFGVRPQSLGVLAPAESTASETPDLATQGAP